MPPGTTKTARGERIRQFSVFLENKVGRLLDLVRALDSAGIHVLGISILDADECSVVRFVPDDCEKLRGVLAEMRLAFTETPMVVVELATPGDLKRVLAALLQAECNIDYLYPLLSIPGGKCLLGLHLDEGDYASTALNAAGFKVLTRRDICR
jgi:hypothetical protein